MSHFDSAIKRLLIRHKGSASNGNVVAMDNTKVLHVSPGEQREARLDRYDQSIYTEFENTRLYCKYDLGLKENTAVDDLKEFIDFAWS